MSKSVKIILGVIIVLVIGGLIAFFCLKDKKIVTDDSLAFKKEYEALNGTVNENNDKEYLSIDIKDYNPIKYSSYEEIFEILESGSGVIYFGFPECPWCRNLVPALTDSAIDFKLDTIYYLNILKDRNKLELSKKDKVTTAEEGTEDYTKLVELLEEFLPEYTLTNSSGKTIKTGEKRVYLPTVVFVKDGKVLGIEQSLSSFSSRVEGDAYQPMNEEEKKELSKIFTSYYEKIEKK